VDGVSTGAKRSNTMREVGGGISQKRRQKKKKWGGKESAGHGGAKLRQHSRHKKKISGGRMRKSGAEKVREYKKLMRNGVCVKQQKSLQPRYTTEGEELGRRNLIEKKKKD